MDDLISRKAAIEAIDAVFPVDPMKSVHTQGIALGAALAKTYIEQLPSAQPDIIHCRECKNCQIDSVFHDYWCDGRKVWKDHYCGYAERRTDE